MLLTLLGSYTTRAKWPRSFLSSPAGPRVLNKYAVRVATSNNMKQASAQLKLMASALVKLAVFSLRTDTGSCLEISFSVKPLASRGRSSASKYLLTRYP